MQKEIIISIKSYLLVSKNKFTQIKTMFYRCVPHLWISVNNLFYDFEKRYL